MKKAILSVALILLTLAANAQWATSYPSSTSVVQNAVVKGETVYVGAVNSKVYSSANNGTSWTNLTNFTPSNAFIESMGINGNRIFAGDGQQGIYYSDNDGSSWTNVSINPPPPLICQVFSFCAVGTTVLAGTSEGIFRSVDNGLSWAQSNTGIPMSSSDVFIYCLYNVGSDIYAGARIQGTGYGAIYKSSDLGNSWTTVNFSFQSAIVTSMVFSGSTIFAGTGTGLYMSANSGSSWTVVNNGLPSGAINILKVGSALFAGGSDGIYRSYDNGVSWLSISTGLPANKAVTPIAVNSSTIFIICDSKVWQRPLSQLLDVKDAIVKANFSIYPNPANNGVFSISNPDNKLTEIEVYNMLGAKVLTSAISSEKATIDLSKQPRGTYSYTVKTKEGIAGNGKLVVN